MSKVEVFCLYSNGYKEAFEVECPENTLLFRMNETAERVLEEKELKSNLTKTQRTVTKFTYT